tara:strand:+ start:1531 stop:2703 length:1173 start_codon:yes stop_codon:yes gene_type:complete
MAYIIKNTFLLFLSIFFSLKLYSQDQIITGADQHNLYLPILKNKKVGIVAHKATRLYLNNNRHLVDFLLEKKIEVIKIFAPEHGFYGSTFDQNIEEDSLDTATGLSIISLYGKSKKPTPDHLKNVDIVVFDLQDVGARFYTFLSTLHYVMQACAEEKIPMIILDRPNPNGHYVDGPVLEMEFKSFVGMHPIPIVHGMTLGEYAQMINGENWLGNNLKCDITIIPVKNYTHKKKYKLPVRPSPNLPNSQSIYLYPSLCLLERTKISIGRGTEKQFQIYGHPNFPKSNFSFIPQSNFGSKNPKWKGQICNGLSLENINPPNHLNLSWIIDAYKKLPKDLPFFLDGFERIAGTDLLRVQIENYTPIEEIRKSWEPELEKFKVKRKKYLIYPDY